MSRAGRQAGSLCKQYYFPQGGETACPARGSGIEILKDRNAADKTIKWDSNLNLER